MVVEGIVTFIGGSCKGRVKIVIKNKGDEEDDYLIWASIIPNNLKVCYTKESHFNIFFLIFKNISVQNSYSVK